MTVHFASQIRTGMSSIWASYHCWKLITTNHITVLKGMRQDLAYPMFNYAREESCTPRTSQSEAHGPQFEESGPANRLKRKLSPHPFRITYLSNDKDVPRKHPDRHVRAKPRFMVFKLCSAGRSVVCYSGRFSASTPQNHVARPVPLLPASSSCRVDQHCS